MAETRRVALFLTREDEAQQMWAKTVREEPQRRGFALIDASYRPELLVSQSEVMVEGVRRALARLAREFSRRSSNGCPSLRATACPPSSAPRPLTRRSSSVSLREDVK